jgi:hypothetical protein
VDLLTPKQCAASIGDIPICVFMEGFLSVMWICTFLLNNTPPQGCLTVPISHTYSCVSTTHPKIKPLTSTRFGTDSKFPIFEIQFHSIQLLWNSLTANSPDKARVSYSLAICFERANARLVFSLINSKTIAPDSS